MSLPRCPGCDGEAFVMKIEKPWWEDGGFRYEYRVGCVGCMSGTTPLYNSEQEARDSWMQMVRRFEAAR